MKYIVALDDHQLETNHTTTNQRWEKTMKQSIGRRCERVERK
jgi:hypothetical protein